MSQGYSDPHPLVAIELPLVFDVILNAGDQHPALVAREILAAFDRSISVERSRP